MAKPVYHEERLRDPEEERQGTFNDEACGDLCTSKKPSRRSPSQTRLYDHICIFCNKVKFLKGCKSRATES